LNLGFQGYAHASTGIREVLELLWSPDVEGRIREARDKTAEVHRETDIELERLRRQTKAAQDQEDRCAALRSRLALESSIQAELELQTRRAKARTAIETAKAELAEKRLADTKARSLQMKRCIPSGSCTEPSKSSHWHDVTTRHTLSLLRLAVG
jgi:hypothetical protein